MSREYNTVDSMVRTVMDTPLVRGSEYVQYSRWGRILDICTVV